MNTERLQVYLELSRMCKVRRVPVDEELEWIKIYNSIQDDKNKDECLRRRIEYVVTQYPEVPMEQYLMEINESCDWDDLRYYEDVYWPDMLTMCKDAVRLGACRVVEQVAPHLLFDNEALLRELLDIAPDGMMRSVLQKCVIPRHDEDYRHYAFAAAYNEEHWRCKPKENASLVSMADGIQQALYRAYINKASHGSELLYFEYATTGEYDSEPITALNLYPESYEMRLHDLGYKLTNDGIEKADLKECWKQNKEFRNLSEKMKISRGIGKFFFVIHLCKWNVEFDGLRNHFGYTGYRYVKSIPDIEERVPVEDHVLKLFYSAINGKIDWDELEPVMREDCHYYDEWADEDVCGRTEIIDLWKKTSRETSALGMQYHAHYARLKEATCHPDLVGPPFGERILAVWQGTFTGHYDGFLFYYLEEGRIIHIYLCRRSGYIFRPFVPMDKREE